MRIPVPWPPPANANAWGFDLFWLTFGRLELQRQRHVGQVAPTRMTLRARPARMFSDIDGVLVGGARWRTGTLLSSHMRKAVALEVERTKAAVWSPIIFWALGFALGGTGR